MIKLTRLDKTEFWLNAHQIEALEHSPDNSVITLASGKKIIVKEDTEKIVKKIIEYRKQINYFKQEE